MTLKKYIEKHGDKACAELFNVTPRACQSWRLGDRLPKIQKALEIVAKTKLSLKDIY